VREICNKVNRAVKRFSDAKLSLYASQASFFIIISAVPFIIILITVLQFIVPITREQLLSAASEVLPDALEGLSVIVVDELYTKSFGSIMSISAIALLWSASKGLAALEIGIKKAYGSNVKGNFLKRKAVSVVYTLILTMVIIFSVLILVFGNTIQRLIEDSFISLAPLFKTILNLRFLMSFLILAGIFAMLYRTLSGVDAKLKKHLPGAVCAAAGWLVFSDLFSIYMENFANYSYIYGSLAAIVIFMLWLYVCIIILLLGAEVNVYIIQSKYIKVRE